MVLSSSVSFFKKLKKNNNRDWFAENKPKFKELELEIKAFGEELKDRLNEFDNVDRFKLFRIYRDIRFSKDKTPSRHILDYIGID
jgi:uncharacterized protein (DUF2461 family)